MHAATNRLEFAPPPPPGLLRAFALAVLAHAFLLAALTWGVHWKRQDVSVAVEAELWSALPQEAAPKLVEPPPPPPAPPEKPSLKPIPKPEPVPEKVQPVVPDPHIAVERAKRLKKERLEAQQKLEQERLEQERREQEKLKLQKKHELEKKALEDKKKAELDAKQDAKRKEALKSQQEAAKIEAQRQENINRMKGLAGASGAPTATGTALQSSGPSAGYAGRIRAAIKPNIVFTDDISGNPMAEVEVRTAPNGTIINHKLLKSSGVKAWDEAVLKAIDKTGDLPRDVDGRVPPALVISFRPKD